MAKRPAHQSGEKTDETNAEPGELFEKLGRQLDDIPAIQSAEQAVRRAAEELKRAEQRYRDVREKASDQLQELRDANVGELVETTLDCVRRYPGAGVLIAAFMGFFLGRLFRR